MKRADQNILLFLNTEGDTSCLKKLRFLLPQFFKVLIYILHHLMGIGELPNEMLWTFHTKDENTILINKHPPQYLTALCHTITANSLDWPLFRFAHCVLIKLFTWSIMVLIESHKEASLFIHQMLTMSRQ